MLTYVFCKHELLPPLSNYIYVKKGSIIFSLFPVFSVSHSHPINSLVETSKLLRGSSNSLVSHFQYSHIHEFTGMYATNLSWITILKGIFSWQTISLGILEKEHHVFESEPVFADVSPVNYHSRGTNFDSVHPQHQNYNSHIWNSCKFIIKHFPGSCRAIFLSLINAFDVTGFHFRHGNNVESINCTQKLMSLVLYET